MQFKSAVEVQHVGNNYWLCKYRMRNERLNTSSAEKDLRIRAGHWPNRSLVSAIMKKVNNAVRIDKTEAQRYLGPEKGNFPNRENADAKEMTVSPVFLSSTDSI